MRLIYTLVILLWAVALCGRDAWTEERIRNSPSGQLLREQHDLEGIQRQIEDKKVKLNQAREKEKTVVSELDRIEKELDEKNKSLRQYEAQLKNDKGEIQDLSRKIDSLQLTLSKQEVHLGRYGEVLYKLSRTDALQTVFSAQSLPDLIREHEYLTRLIDYNAGIIDQYLRNIEEIEAERTRLEKNKQRLEEVTGKARSTQDQIVRHKNEKTTLLTKVKSEKEVHLSALKELEEASRRLQALMDELGKRDRGRTPLGTKQFSTYKSQFIFPVEGDIITIFGRHEDEAFSTISFNKGIEISAAMGSPIKAVFDGAVIYADWFKGYGNLLILDHGEGYYTLSGHASELLRKVGDGVKEGETVGYVGDTGSLKGPNLYFEIRHHGKPLDPLDWLNPKK